MKLFLKVNLKKIISRQLNDLPIFFYHLKVSEVIYNNLNYQIPD